MKEPLNLHFSTSAVGAFRLSEQPDILDILNLQPSSFIYLFDIPSREWKLQSVGTVSRCTPNVDVLIRLSSVPEAQCLGLPERLDVLLSNVIATHRPALSRSTATSHLGVRIGSIGGTMDTAASLRKRPAAVDPTATTSRSKVPRLDDTSTAPSASPSRSASPALQAPTHLPPSTLPPSLISEPSSRVSFPRRYYADMAAGLRELEDRYPDGNIPTKARTAAFGCVEPVCRKRYKEIVDFWRTVPSSIKEEFDEMPRSEKSTWAEFKRQARNMMKIRKESERDECGGGGGGGGGDAGVETSPMEGTRPVIWMFALAEILDSKGSHKIQKHTSGRKII